MSDAITQATKQVSELAQFRLFLATRSMERFVVELGEALEDAGIPPEDRGDIFTRLASEARQAVTDTQSA